MKSRVSPDPGATRPLVSAHVSRVRTTVVPTAQTRPPAPRFVLIVWAASSVNRYASLCMTCWARSSASTGLNVPGPMCRSSSAMATPLSRSRPSIAAVKCKPAVGAATLPSCVAYTVQSRRDHPRRVEDQDVARCYEVDEIGKARVADGAARSLQHQEPTGRAVGEWFLSDEFARERVVEVGGVHENNAERGSRNAEQKNAHLFRVSRSAFRCQTSSAVPRSWGE